FQHIRHTVENTPADMVLRWSALLHDIGKPNCASCDANGIIHFYGHHRESVTMANDILHRMRLDNDTIRDILILIENHDVRIENTYPGVKRMMTRTGEVLFEKLLLLQEADNLAKNNKFFREKKKKLLETEEIYRKIISEHQPYTISELAVNGKDLIKIGYKPGRNLGNCLKKLLDEVIINPELNRREYLLMRAKDFKKIK
ncbi:MAG: HD domain-containing protein, partial [Clostridia bacterium]|nr:HD domain-containing protein [Clostridia bacterium]